MGRWGGEPRKRSEGAGSQAAGVSTAASQGPAQAPQVADDSWFRGAGAWAQLLLPETHVATSGVGGPAPERRLWEGAQAAALP